MDIDMPATNKGRTMYHTLRSAAKQVENNVQSSHPTGSFESCILFPPQIPAY